MQCKAFGIIAATALSTLLCANAFADVSASATFSNFTIQLFDTNPTDQVGPSVVFYNTYGSVARTLDVSYAPPSPNTYLDKYSDGFLGSVVSAQSYPTVSSSVSMTGDPFTGTAVMSATASAADYPGYNYAAAVLWLADNAAITGFTLSAGTRLTITATADLSATSTEPMANETASADASLQLGYFLPNTPPPVVSQSSVFAGQNYWNNPASDTIHTTMSVSFSSAADASTQGFFTGQLSAIAVDENLPSIPVVPEPTTGLLILAGLALSAATVFRGQSQGRQ